MVCVCIKTLAHGTCQETRLRRGLQTKYANVWFSDIRLCFFTCYNWTRLGVIVNTPTFDLAISDCFFFTCYNWTRLGVIENTPTFDLAISDCFFYVLQLNKVGSYWEYAIVWFSDIRLCFFTCYNWTRLGVIENTPSFDLAISDCVFFLRVTTDGWGLLRIRSLTFEQCWELLWTCLIKFDWLTYLTVLFRLMRLIVRCALYLKKFENRPFIDSAPYNPVRPIVRKIRVGSGFFRHTVLCFIIPQLCRLRHWHTSRQCRRSEERINSSLGHFSKGRPAPVSRAR